MNSARLMLDARAPGHWNMAVDEALLESAPRTRTMTLRIYGWSAPTLSLGYFQPYRERETHSPSLGCPVVRRATGGGAIVHDHEITYSLTAPAAGRTDRQLLTWYDLVHDAWLATLRGLGVNTQRCSATDPQKERQFLCFQRRCAGDLLVGTMKIGGSAQRRHTQAALQHGSLLLRQSAAAPELPGIAELAGRDLTDGEWLGEWVDLMGRALGVAWNVGHLADDERERAVELDRGKYGDAAWTQRR